MKQLAYVNGKIVDLESATIPVLDRGFIFGDGIYEVVRVYEGVPFGLGEHLKRLENSAAEILLPLPHTLETFEELIMALLEESDCREGSVYLQITRGVAPRSHAFPEHSEPTIVMFVKGIPPDLEESKKNGAACITLPDERWFHCNIKSVSLLANVMAKELAHRQNAFECILYRPGGRVTEGSSSNVFAVLDGVVRTHPANNLILPGITREYILRLCAHEGIPFEETAFLMEDMERATEVFLTGTVAEITPVITVDGRAVREGTPGPIASFLVDAYRSLVKRTVK